MHRSGLKSKQHACEQVCEHMSGLEKKGWLGAECKNDPAQEVWETWNTDFISWITWSMHIFRLNSKQTYTILEVLNHVKICITLHGALNLKFIRLSCWPKYCSTSFPSCACAEHYMLSLLLRTSRSPRNMYSLYYCTLLHWKKTPAVRIGQNVQECTDSYLLYTYFTSIVGC